MPSSLVLESLEQRALLSATMPIIAAPFDVERRFVLEIAAQVAALYPGNHDLASDANQAALHPADLLALRPMEVAEGHLSPPSVTTGQGVDPANIHSSPDAVSKGENWMALADRASFLDSMGYPNPDADDDMHDHPPPGDGMHFGTVEVVNSLVDGDDDDPYIADNSHDDFRDRDLEITKVSGIPGVPGLPGMISGGTGRTLDALLGEYDLGDPLAGLDLVLRSGPLADSFILDGWGEGVPPPQADLVPVTGQNLTVMPAYLVGVPAQAPSPNLAAQAVDPGSTHFIVGLWGPQAEKTGPRTVAEAESRLRDPMDQIVDSLRLTETPALLPLPATAEGDMEDVGTE